MSDDMLRELYQEVIIDHNRNPRNFGELAGATHHADGFNPLCGDKLSLRLLVDQNNRIQDIKFTGTGCAISTASASIMTELLMGQDVAKAHQIFEQFHDLVTMDKAIDFDLGKLAVLAGVKNFPARVKCATLAWHTLDAAINNDGQPVTTE